MSTPTQPADLQPARPTRGAYPFKRLLFSVLFLGLLWLSLWAIFFIAVAQFVLRIFDADASDDLRAFGGRLGRYMGEMAAYVSFAREEAPFPFARFPDAKPD
ncbi:hypothetical protein sos41_29720 [Alphaproteobacteria bacterium SO-S41]|nr:hypothetical protein sos41_29720 [Alphaproteobacteria bacterium SO-S41]